MTVRVVRNCHPLVPLFAVREHGMAALKSPVNAERLARLDPEIRAEVDKQIVELVSGRARRLKQEADQQRPRARKNASR
jgi:hypothetical protein